MFQFLYVFMWFKSKPDVGTHIFLFLVYEVKPTCHLCHNGLLSDWPQYPESVSIALAVIISPCPSVGRTLVDLQQDISNDVFTEWLHCGPLMRILCGAAMLKCIISASHSFPFPVLLPRVTEWVCRERSGWDDERREGNEWSPPHKPKPVCSVYMKYTSDCIVLGIFCEASRCRGFLKGMNM